MIHSINHYLVIFKWWQSLVLILPLSMVPNLVRGTSQTDRPAKLGHWSLWRQHQQLSGQKNNGNCQHNNIWTNIKIPLSNLLPLLSAMDSTAATVVVAATAAVVAAAAALAAAACIQPCVSAVSIDLVSCDNWEQKMLWERVCQRDVSDGYVDFSIDVPAMSLNVWVGSELGSIR